MGKRHSIRARDVEARTRTIYPAEFAPVTEGRAKRALGNAFGLDQFGVNLTDLAPGAASALKHWHSAEDEFVYVLAGEPTLLIGEDEETLAPGDYIGFKAGVEVGHAIVNRTSQTVTILEVGSRRMDVDRGAYPEHDLAVEPDGQGGRRFTRKDGSPV